MLHLHQPQEEESLSLHKKSTKLDLHHTDREGLLTGKKTDGRNYSVRLDRRRYFFPNEWNSFISEIKNPKHKFFFVACIHTGGRVMEILNLRNKDIDVDRSTVKFEIIKQRKAKKNFYGTGKARGFFVSSEFIRKYKSFVRGKNINPDHYIFLENKKLPENYNKLNNQDRKKYYVSKVVSYSNILKRKLKKIGIKDYYNFSLHNIRKTYGMWMRTFNIEIAEICYRMGHDVDTYLAHYGSSLIFTESERREISKIMGDVK